MNFLRFSAILNNISDSIIQDGPIFLGKIRKWTIDQGTLLHTDREMNFLVLSFKMAVYLFPIFLRAKNSHRGFQLGHGSKVNLIQKMTHKLNQVSDGI